MPDIFEPNHPFPIDKFPPKTKEEKAELQKFFGGVASPPENAKKLLSFGKALRSDGIKRLGVYGFCWGGRILTSWLVSLLTDKKVAKLLYSPRVRKPRSM